MNYESALEYIHAVQWAGHKPGLSRTRTLLAALGDPHKKLRFVHVAGTNGKGSTAAMLASCLQAAGYRVGLYTSPFINRFNERIQVNGEQIPDDALVRLVVWESSSDRLCCRCSCCLSICLKKNIWTIRNKRDTNRRISEKIMYFCDIKIL